MFIPRCTRMIGEPFNGQHKVTVFSDGCVPVAHLALCLGVKKDTFDRKLKDHKMGDKHCAAETSMYRTDTHQKVRNLITKEGVSLFLKEHAKWDDQKIQRGLDELYNKDNVYTSPRVAKKAAASPKKKCEDESSIASMSASSDGDSDDDKHELTVKSLKKCLNKHERKMERRTGDQAVYRYQQTPEFQERVQEKLAEAVAQKADALYPMLRKQLEERIEREEEKTIRAQARKRIREEGGSRRIEVAKRRIFAYT